VEALLPTAPRTENSGFNQLLAGQAKAQQQFEEVFRRLDRAEETAGEARDTAKELVTILREQNIGERLAETRGEMAGLVAALRQDVVAANTLIRSDAKELCDRVEALEAERNKVIGVAGFFTWLTKVAPWLLSGIAAFYAGLKSGIGQ
jgi:ABC-type phosphate transport system auxiliary subunit